VVVVVERNLGGCVVWGYLVEMADCEALL
jgi:hypothetical protein